MRMELWIIAANAFWLAAPAYAANAFPPLVRGRKPLDRDAMLHGRRLFGDGKTIEGTVSGIAFGIFIGIMQLFFQPYVADVIAPYGTLILLSPVLIALLSAGAMAGDIIGSFIKRRMGMERGSPALLLDQLGFVVTALLFSMAVVSVMPEVFAFLVIVTPVVHWIANQIGYHSGVKKHPW